MLPRGRLFLNRQGAKAAKFLGSDALEGAVPNHLPRAITARGQPQILGGLGAVAVQKPARATASLRFRWRAARGRASPGERRSGLGPRGRVPDRLRGFAR